MDAALIGGVMSFIAPLCNAIYCNVFLEMPFTSTIWGMLSRMIPLAILCVFLAIGCSFLCPERLSLALKDYQRAIPVVSNSLLYSIYFSMLGANLVRGDVYIFQYYATYYALVPALIDGFATFTHIIVRPRFRNVN